MIVLSWRWMLGMNGQDELVKQVLGRFFSETCFYFKLISILGKIKEVNSENMHNERVRVLGSHTFLFWKVIFYLLGCFQYFISG